MKILIITDFVPYPPSQGALSRVYGLSSQLCKRHEVVLFAPTREPSDPEGIKYLREIGMTVETVSKPRRFAVIRALRTRFAALFGRIPAQWVIGWDGHIGRGIRRAVEKHRPDVVYVHHLSTCRFYRSFALGAPLVLDQHNVESELEAHIARTRELSIEHTLRRMTTSRVLPFEKDMMSRMDLVVAVSERDMAILQGYAPGTRMVTVPNGVNLEYFQPGGPEVENSIVFTGTLSYFPNSEAAALLASEILPRVQSIVPDVKTRIVGRNPTRSVMALSGPSLEVLGDVPDIRPYMEEASVVVVPLRSGSGTRLKILEAMAMGKTIVSTRKGAEGLDVTDGADIVLRDDAGEFAEAVAELLASPEKRKIIGRNARATVESKYSYAALSLVLEEAMLGLLGKPGAGL